MTLKKISWKGIFCLFLLSMILSCGGGSNRAESSSQLNCWNCPEDVELSKDNDFEIEDITFDLRSRYGYKIHVRAVGPRLSKYPGKRFPVVLRIAGGWGNSTFLLNNELTRQAASDGLIVTAFDSEPKLKEEIGSGIRDYNGFKDQDDAAAVLEHIFRHQNVNTEMIGVWSHSNGITLASGVLGRAMYRQIGSGIKFLLDDEGPHCPMDILNLPIIEEIVAEPEVLERWQTVLEAKVGDGKDYDTAEEFFQERCAVNFIGGFSGLYQRVQADYDHALTYYHGHAVEMLNKATTGDALWTRLNRGPEDQTYRSVEFPDGIDIDEVIDIKELQGPNDSRIWDVLFYLFDQ